MERKRKIIEFLYRDVFAFVFGALTAVYLSYTFGWGNWVRVWFQNRLIGLAFVLGCGLIGMLYRRHVKRVEER